MKTIDSAEEIMYILANEKDARYDVVIHEENNTYVYKLNEKDIEEDYKGIELIRLISNGKVVILEDEL